MILEGTGKIGENRSIGCIDRLGCDGSIRRVLGVVRADASGRRAGIHGGARVLEHEKTQKYVV